MNPTELQHSLREASRGGRDSGGMPHPRPDPPALDPAQRPDADLEGQTRPVFSPVRTRAADGTLTPVELGSFPVTGIEEADAAIEAACRPTTTAAAPGPRCRWPAHRLRRELHQPAGHPARRDRQPHHVGDRQRAWPTRRRSSTAPSTTSRPPSPSSSSSTTRTRASRSSTARSPRSAARRSGIVLCLGPYNYPMNETFCPHPGAHHG